MCVKKRRLILTGYLDERLNPLHALAVAISRSFKQGSSNRSVILVAGSSRVKSWSAKKYYYLFVKLAVYYSIKKGEEVI